MNGKSKSILRKSKSNFAKAFIGLPKDRQAALAAVYAYCRTVDDIVDESPDPKQALLELDRWRDGFEQWPNFASVVATPVAHDLEDATQKFPLQRSDLTWILDGVSRDLSKTRYDTMNELIEYCDGVASAVGFCCMAIFGVERKLSETYAFSTGRALQLTNILRDIASDARRGRIYIPREVLNSFHVSEKDLLESSYDEKFLAMAGHFAGKIDQYYSVAREEAKKLPMRKIWPAEIMRKTYFQIFKKIRRKKFNVFRGKIGINAFYKAWIAVTQSKGNDGV